MPLRVPPPRDTIGRPIVEGSYMLSRPGNRPRPAKISTDQTTLDLWIESDGHRGPLNEMPIDATLAKCIDAETWDALLNTCSHEQLENLLANAAELRQGLAAIERQVADQLKAELGDGTPLADAILSAVRDGMGNAIDLIEAAKNG